MMRQHYYKVKMNRVQHWTVTSINIVIIRRLPFDFSSSSAMGLSKRSQKIKQSLIFILYYGGRLNYQVKFIQLIVESEQCNCRTDLGVSQKTQSKLALLLHVNSPCNR